MQFPCNFSHTSELRHKMETNVFLDKVTGTIVDTHSNFQCKSHDKKKRIILYIII